MQKLTLKGQEGYAYGPNEIENIAKLYGYGTGAIKQDGTSGARSITIEDVDRIHGYTSETPTSYTYSKENDGYIYVNGTKGEGNYTIFNYYDNGWKSLEIGESITLQNTYYYYSLRRTGAEEILRNEGYWLPSHAMYCDPFGEVYYRIRFVRGNGVDSSYLCSSYDMINYNDLAVRPVVSIQI